MSVIRTDIHQTIMYRIGIDVGGTNIDAVVMSEREVIGWAKCPTTSDVTSGILAALSEVLANTGINRSAVEAAMIGTTHFTNAFIQRRGLTSVAVFRLCGPATHSLPPMIDWPSDLYRAVQGYTALLPGGFEFDGRLITPLDERALRKACREARALGLKTFAVTRDV